MNPSEFRVSGRVLSCAVKSPGYNVYGCVCVCVYIEIGLLASHNMWSVVGVGVGGGGGGDRNDDGWVLKIIGNNIFGPLRRSCLGGCGDWFLFLFSPRGIASRDVVLMCKVRCVWYLIVVVFFAPLIDGSPWREEISRCNQTP